MDHYLEKASCSRRLPDHDPRSGGAAAFDRCFVIINAWPFNSTVTKVLLGSTHAVNLSLPLVRGGNE